MKRITNSRSKAGCCGLSTRSAEAEELHSVRQHVEELVELVCKAFQNVKLGDGIGLYESDGIDSYLGSEAREQLRANDEKEDWRKISTESLNYCNAAPAFLDADGMRFHTPAFLMAELKGVYNQSFMSCLIDGTYIAAEFPMILTADQRAAVVACIRFYGSIEHYNYDSEQIAAAVARFS